MSLIITILSIFLISLSSYGQIIDIVFDIDWTLVYPLPGPPPTHMKNVVFSEGQYYRITDWAQEVLAQLHRKPDIRISFFSGGDQVRNLDLLKQIKLSEDLNALNIAYKILSKGDLTSIDTETNMRFTEKFKKDISLINKDTQRVILIDDSDGFVLPAQHKNQLWLGETYNFYEYSGDIPIEKSKYDPPNIESWARERKKILSVYAAIEEIYKNRHRENMLEYLPKMLPKPVDPCSLHF